MATSGGSLAYRLIARTFQLLAKAYLRVHRSRLVVVAGSVGKTSSKLMLATFLQSEKRVSYMDDSYNSGLGLYLSVFKVKVPDNPTPFGWLKLLLKVLGRFFRHYEIVLLEYGIDQPGEMDEMIVFARPDNALLTAVTPEHMEFLKTIDIVGEEETKILAAAKDFGVVNSVDVNPKYIKPLETKLYRYGSAKSDASYKILSLDGRGSAVEFVIDGHRYAPQTTKVIAEPLVRQIAGALLMAQKLGISPKSLQNAIGSIEPAASRMRPFEGVNGSILIDDSANFSPVAGVVALKTLKQLKANRHIAILRNMHELGEFIEEGYRQVGREFKGIDVLILVGELSKEHFGKIAKAQKFTTGKNLFFFDRSTEAGIFARDSLVREGDAVLVKGPFGGFYLEEAAKKLLADPSEWVFMTRQSEFWLRKKRRHFGASLDG